jgi:hypothetical protein
MGQRRTLFLAAIFMFTAAAVTNRAVCATAAPSAKSRCTAKELGGQDCWLKAGVYSLRLLEGTIAWNTGVRHFVDPTPLRGEGVSWERAQFEMFKTRPILQLWFWDKGEGEAKVQSLHWYVLETTPRRLDVLVEGVVRKRHRETSPDQTAAENANPAPVRYIYDPWETHSLKLLKNGDLEWHLGRQTKILQKVDDDGV